MVVSLGPGGVSMDESKKKWWNLNLASQIAFRPGLGDIGAIAEDYCLEQIFVILQHHDTLQATLASDIVFHCLFFYDVTSCQILSELAIKTSFDTVSVLLNERRISAPLPPFYKRLPELTSQAGQSPPIVILYCELWISYFTKFYVWVGFTLNEFIYLDIYMKLNFYCVTGFCLQMYVLNFCFYLWVWENRDSP